MNGNTTLERRTERPAVIASILILVTLIAGTVRASEISAGTVTATGMVRQTSSTGTNYFMGNIGIGTTNPTASLTLDGWEQDVDIINGYKDGKARFAIRYHKSGPDYMEMYIIDDDDAYEELKKVLTLSRTGGARLGIGLQTNDLLPRASLHVSGSGTTNKAIVLLGADSADDDNTWSELRFSEDTDGEGNMSHGLRWVYDSGENALLLYRHASSTTGVETVRITRNEGYVGIGTTEPTEGLHVGVDSRFDTGVKYVAALGDVTMGSYTNQP